MTWNPSGKPQELGGMAVAKRDRGTAMLASSGPRDPAE